MIHYLFIILMHFFCSNISAGEHPITMTSDTECLICYESIADVENPAVRNSSLITACCQQFICSKCDDAVKSRAHKNKRESRCPNCQKTPLTVYIGRFIATKDTHDPNNASVTFIKSRFNNHCSFLGTCFH